MKRIGFMLASATGFVLAVAAPALAGSGSAHNPRPGGPGVSGSGGTAFTGANVSTAALYLVAFLVIGALAIFIARRRASLTH